MNITENVKPQLQGQIHGPEQEIQAGSVDHFSYADLVWLTLFTECWFFTCRGEELDRGGDEGQVPRATCWHWAKLKEGRKKLRPDWRALLIAYLFSVIRDKRDTLPDDTVPCASKGQGQRKHQCGRGLCGKCHFS